MKKHLYFGYLLLIGSCLLSACRAQQGIQVSASTLGTPSSSSPQVQKVDGKPVVPDVLPVFSKGDPLLWVAKNVVYPKEAMVKGIQGKVWIEFIIDEQGEVKSPRILKSSGSALLDAAGMEVISRMPKWSPPLKDGKAISMPRAMPIAFMMSQ